MKTTLSRVFPARIATVGRNLRAVAPTVTLAALLLIGCGAPDSDSQAEAGGLASDIVSPFSEEAEASSGENLVAISTEWTGDFDEMAERRVIRALVVYNRLLYFLDGGRERGISYEALTEFEKVVNQRQGTKHLKVHVVMIPVRRDQLIPALEAGLGDLAVGNLTVTPERLEKVDFSTPGATRIDEILVTGPEAPALEMLEDLGGKEIYVRRSSSYWTSLERLNGELSAAGKPTVRLRAADEYLEDGDLLEMVNAGVLPWAVVDDLKARLWSQVFEHLTLRPDLAVATGGEVAWAMRKNSPQLKKVVDEFIRGHKQGTLFGNILINRYAKDTKHIRNALTSSEMAKFDKVKALFQKYGAEYGIDYLLLAAQGYQESTLDQSKRSRSGAIGIMQLLPTTAADPNVGISGIENVNNNIHAGAKYLKFIRERYFNDEAIDPVNRALFSFAAYNAGPGRMSKLRKEAAQMGLDPNVWFRNVEVVAAKRIGRETVQYVSNIYKYYITYTQVMRLEAGRRGAREELND